MRTFRAYLPIDSIDFEERYQLLLSTSHHLVKVLRVKVDDLIEVFDGKGNRFEAQITEIGKQVTLKLLRKLVISTESPLKIRLLIAVGKGDKMDWIVQKATELGVTEIQPITTSRCEVRLSEERWQKKIHHWQEIVINACEQSGRDYLPLVNNIANLSKSLQEGDNYLKILLHPNQQAERLQIITSQNQSNQLILLIGPEGGFDDKEVKLALASGFRLASLGPRILRMETAALASIAILQAVLGDI